MFGDRHALVITLHYSKGNKANTQTGERFRGSSVFMGDVDAAIEFVAQQDADESNNIPAVEAVLREFPPVKPFCVQWDGRALFEVSQHDASKKKKAGGRPSDHNEKDLLELGADFGCYRRGESKGRAGRDALCL